MSWLDLPSPELGLCTTIWVLFGSAFLAATILPLASEFVLVAACAAFPSDRMLLVGIATLGNLSGALTTYALGYFLQERLPQRWQPTFAASQRVQRWGPLVLFWSWVPLLGDALVAAAGLLRLPIWPCLAWLGLGKLLRYVAIAGLFTFVA